MFGKTKSPVPWAEIVGTAGALAGAGVAWWSCHQASKAADASAASAASSLSAAKAADNSARAARAAAAEAAKWSDRSVRAAGEAETAAHAAAVSSPLSAEDRGRFVLLQKEWDALKKELGVQ